MNIHMAKKWPELVVQRSFIKGHSFRIRVHVSLPSSEDDVSTSCMPSGGRIVTLLLRTILPGDEIINDDLRGWAVLFS